MKVILFPLKRLYPLFLTFQLILLLIFGAFLFHSAVFLNDSGELMAVSAEAMSGRVIILDAGHGGEDSGAIGINGTLEKDLNLTITLALGEYLAEQGQTVIYTRTQDRLLYAESENIKGIRKISDLKNRCAVAQEYPEGIFVSIHMNSFAQESSKGLQVYYAPDSQEAQTLANTIQKSVVQTLQPQNKRLTKKGMDIFVLENASIPAVLVECGFLSNREECLKLNDPIYQRELAKSIAQGILEYKEP